MARGDGPALTAPPGEGRAAVEAVWRAHAARIVATLARSTGDLALAEDVAQEALAAALVSWPREGVPARPAAWLVTVARRRAVDAFRRRAARDDRYAALAREAAVLVPGPDAELADPDAVGDDVLALMFVACHPVLSRTAQVALTLRVVGGLTSEEIARAFLVPTATVQARITRAKKTLSAARVPFAVPSADERRERLGAVLAVVYLIFTEGSTATSGDDLLRPDLAHEAVRLARVLAHLAPEEAEALGLLALLELTAARFPARVASDGSAVLLEDQDRGRWDRAAIRRGRAALTAAARHGLGAYGLQAAIAECHAVAPSVAATDWERIVLLYDALGRLAPSPVVALNRAVAVAMAHGPAAALPLVDGLADAGALAGSHLLPGVRGELLHRLGRTSEARVETERALALCGNEPERQVLRRRLASLAAARGTGP